MEPILLQELLNNSSDQRLAQDPHSDRFWLYETSFSRLRHGRM